MCRKNLIHKVVSGILAATMMMPGSSWTMPSGQKYLRAPGGVSISVQGREAAQWTPKIEEARKILGWQQNIVETGLDETIKKAKEFSATCQKILTKYEEDIRKADAKTEEEVSFGIEQSFYQSYKLIYNRIKNRNGDKISKLMTAINSLLGHYNNIAVDKIDIDVNIQEFTEANENLPDRIDQVILEHLENFLKKTASVSVASLNNTLIGKVIELEKYNQAIRKITGVSEKTKISPELTGLFILKIFQNMDLNGTIVSYPESANTLEDGEIHLTIAKKLYLLQCFEQKDLEKIEEDEEFFNASINIQLASARKKMIKLLIAKKSQYSTFPEALQEIIKGKIKESTVAAHFGSQRAMWQGLSENLDIQSEALFFTLVDKKSSLKEGANRKKADELFILQDQIFRNICNIISEAALDSKIRNNLLYVLNVDNNLVELPVKIASHIVDNKPFTEKELSRFGLSEKDIKFIISNGGMSVKKSWKPHIIEPQTIKPVGQNKIGTTVERLEIIMESL